MQSLGISVRLYEMVLMLLDIDFVNARWFVFIVVLVTDFVIGVWMGYRARGLDNFNVHSSVC